MPSGYRSGGGSGVDFDELFDPYVQGTKPAPTGRRVLGVDLCERYAPLVFGTRRADVGYRVNGVDVSSLWAAKGTAVYVSDGGLPPSLASYAQVPPGQSVIREVSFEYRPDGVVAWDAAENGRGSGRWLGGGSPAGDYEIRFDVVSGVGFTGASGQWLRLDVARGGAVQVSSSNNLTMTKSTRLHISMRKRSDQSAVFTNRVLDMSVTVDRDGAA
ncbi:MAG TPA: hypothetical protein VIG88_09425 [Lysobacter sp.]